MQVTIDGLCCSSHDGRRGYLTGAKSVLAGHFPQQYGLSDALNPLWLPLAGVEEVADDGIPQNLGPGFETERYVPVPSRL